jgi:hypothetical protein
VCTGAQCSVLVICGIEISLDSEKTFTNFSSNNLVAQSSNLENNPEAADQEYTQD